MLGGLRRSRRRDARPRRVFGGPAAGQTVPLTSSPKWPIGSAAREPGCLRHVSKVLAPMIPLGDTVPASATSRAIFKEKERNAPDSLTVAVDRSRSPAGSPSPAAPARRPSWYRAGRGGRRGRPRRMRALCPLRRDRRGRRRSDRGHATEDRGRPRPARPCRRPCRRGPPATPSTAPCGTSTPSGPASAPM